MPHVTLNGMKIKCSWRQLWHWWFREVKLDKAQTESGDWTIGEEDQFMKNLTVTGKDVKMQTKGYRIYVRKVFSIMIEK